MSSSSVVMKSTRLVVIVIGTCPLDWDKTSHGIELQLYTTEKQRFKEFCQRLTLADDLRPKPPA